MNSLQAREEKPEVELSKTDMVNEKQHDLMIQGPRDKISLYCNLFLWIQEVYTTKTKKMQL